MPAVMSTEMNSTFSYQLHLDTSLDRELFGISPYQLPNGIDEHILFKCERTVLFYLQAITFIQ